MYEYTTPEQQIEKLKRQNLSFIDENKAKAILELYGYYNIINGYRDPYIIRENSNKKYTVNVTFEQIFSLFTFDHRIREAVLLSMIDLEEHLRAVVADIIAKDFGTDHNAYLSRNYYRDKYVSNPNFRRNKILDGMLQIAHQSQTQPIKYYRETHQIIPPWILLKGIPFGTLVNYIRFFKASQRNKLIHTLYGFSDNDENMEFYKDLLSDTLFFCLEYRNLAAHGGRIYNYTPNSTIRHCDDGKLKKGLPQLLFILKLLSYQQPSERLEYAINMALKDYCSSYPNDLQRIKEATGFSVKVEPYVWANLKSHKVHNNLYCGGSMNNQKMSLKDAERLGFVPCKRCFTQGYPEHVPCNTV